MAWPSLIGPEGNLCPQSVAAAKSPIKSPKTLAQTKIVLSVPETQMCVYMKRILARMAGFEGGW